MSQLPIAVIGPGWSGTTHRLRVIVDEFDGGATWVVASPLETGVEFGALRTIGGISGAAGHHEAADAVQAALGDDLLVVDDAHDLDEQSIRAVATLVERGRPVAVAHRPTGRTAIGALDDVIERHGEVARLGPLDEAELGAVLASSLGSAIDTDLVAEIHRHSAGFAGMAMALVDGQGALLDEPDAVGERVAAELRRAGEATRQVAEVLAMASQPPDDVVCRTAGVAEAELTAISAALDRAGLTGAESLELVPAVQVAVRGLLSAAERRSVHRRLAQALIERGGEAIEAAEHLLAAGATGAEAADVYVRAGDDLRFSRSEDALRWYDEAEASGATGSRVAAGRAEAAAFAGSRIHIEALGPEVPPADRARLLAVRAAESSREGRLDRSQQLYGQIEGHPLLTADATTALAATALVGLGRLDEARAASRRSTDPLDARADVARFLGDAVVSHSTDPQSSAPLFVEAAEALERVDLDMVLPESPHALAALCLSLSGDLLAAEALLQRAAVATPAGPAFDTRHRLLMAWVHLRSARYELPTRELTAIDPGQLDGRDRLLHAAIGAGLARRSGDVPALRTAWADAEPVLLRGVGDLFHLEPLTELILASARLRQRERAQPVIDVIAEAVDRVGDARAWTIPSAWLEVQLAIEEEDVDAARAATETLGGIDPATGAQEALQAVARIWCELLEDRVEPEVVSDVATGLAAAHLPWEASRVTGQAAVRVRDQATARRLLEQARAFHHDPDTPTASVATDAGLTSREVDVGRYVLDGLTYREIGAQLYISPKTVEHHVARIRRKVQARTRAEMLAALRELFSDQGEARTGGGG